MTATSPLEAGGPLARLERAAWDVRAMPNRADVRVLLDSHAELLEALEGLVAKSTDIGGDWSTEWLAALTAIARARSEHTQ